MIRVLVADDHPLFREGIASLIKRTTDIELVGAAATGEQATLLARDLLPDVVLMDLAMPGRGGIEATRQIVRENPHIGVLVVTMFEDDESVFAAVRAGGRGYVLKDADPEGLLRAIQAVAALLCLAQRCVSGPGAGYWSTSAGLPSPAALQW